MPRSASRSSTPPTSLCSTPAAQRIRITAYDTARGAVPAANEALAEGNGLILGPLLAEDVRAVAPIARRERRAGHRLLQRCQRRRRRRLSDGLHARPVDRAGRRLCARARREPLRRAGADQRLWRARRPGDDRRRSRARAAGWSASRPSTRARPASRAAATRLNGQGATDAVLIADGPRAALPAVPVVRQRSPQPRLLGTELWATESNIGANVGLRGAWFAAPSDAMFNQFRTRYRARYNATPSGWRASAMTRCCWPCGSRRTGRSAGRFPARALRDAERLHRRRRRLPLRPRRRRRPRARGARGDRDRAPTSSRRRRAGSTDRRSRPGSRRAGACRAGWRAGARRSRVSRPCARQARDRAPIRGQSRRPQIDALGEAQAHEQRLDAALRPAGSPSPRRCRGRCAASAASQFSGFLWRCVGVAAAPAVRAGADAGISAVAPVSEIVPALLAGAGVVGDFIGGQAGRRGHRPGSARRARRSRPDRRGRARRCAAIAAKRVPGSMVSW